MNNEKPRDISLDDIPEPIEKTFERNEKLIAEQHRTEKKKYKIGRGNLLHGQVIEKREGIKKPGTTEFLNKVEKRRKAEKLAKKQRKRNRRK